MWPSRHRDPMNVEDLIVAIRDQGDLLANAAEKTGPEAEVPTCPAWCVRDLVQHQGEVHRWAAAIVRDSLSSPEVAPPEWPDDDELVPWFRQGCDELVDVLGNADAGVECFAFLPAPSPLVFWARRQAHETGIHRVDAEAAAGTLTPFPVDLAADGIEEMVFGFASRSRSKLRSPSPRTVALQATDAGQSWVVRIGPESVEASRGEAAADCTVRAGASDLFMLLWNRVPRSVAGVQGDDTLLDLWQDKVQIRWS
jgi:uncharacterized protein (TIGR03083 family)